jgi:hypothetical protein
LKQPFYRGGARQVKEETHSRRQGGCTGKLDAAGKNDVTLMGVDYDRARMESKPQIQSTQSKLGVPNKYWSLSIKNTVS